MPFITRRNSPFRRIAHNRERINAKKAWRAMSRQEKIDEIVAYRKQLKELQEARHSESYERDSTAGSQG